MARQPYLPAYKKYPYAIGANQLDSRPDFINAIGRCLTFWPYIEHHMAMILGVLMKADNEASIAVFSSIRMGRTQRDALNTAASVALSDKPEMLKLLNALLSTIEKAGEARADLAHGCWGILTTREDRVAWIDSKHHGPWNTLAITKGVGHEGLQKHLFVWSLQDIADVQTQLEKCWEAIFDYFVLLGGSQTKGLCGLSGEQLHQHLCQRPHIAEALARLDRRQNGKKAPT
jgi:hypothetical protein